MQDNKKAYSTQSNNPEDINIKSSKTPGIACDGYNINMLIPEGFSFKTKITQRKNPNIPYSIVKGINNFKAV